MYKAELACVRVQLPAHRKSRDTVFDDFVLIQLKYFKMHFFSLFPYSNFSARTSALSALSASTVLRLSSRSIFITYGVFPSQPFLSNMINTDKYLLLSQYTFQNQEGMLRVSLFSLSSPYLLHKKALTGLYSYPAHFKLPF